MEYSLEGTWQVRLPSGICKEAVLPGTLDENKIGGRDKAPGSVPEHMESSDSVTETGTLIATRLTRNYTYEGEAVFTRRIHFTETPGKRVFLEAERARLLRLLIDGREVPHFLPPTISTPQVFEVTGLLEGEGTHELTLISDNSYPGLPHDAIVYSSAATDETQTNWNGVLGYVRLREEESVFIESVRIYPRGDFATVKARIAAQNGYEGALTLHSEVFAGAEKSVKVQVRIPVGSGLYEVIVEKIPLAQDVRRWEEYEGNLYQLTASLSVFSLRTVRFGVRDFGANKSGRLTLNGRVIFLRGEANCAVFPETGYPPMEVAKWKEILAIYKSYGINCVRFHSHCPPEAAFTAADEMGMLMQPELSHWNPKDALESEESFSYYQTELTQIQDMLANHPSFVMLTLGNELCTGETGKGRMQQMILAARERDDTRLYASASNGAYGAEGYDGFSDFYTSSNYGTLDLRGSFAAYAKEEGIKGHINCRYPDARMTYEPAAEALRKDFAGPVFGFEIGQFQVLPDFGELGEFHGVTRPDNLELVRRRAEEAGCLKNWEKYVEATGELALLSYREEVEAVLRTKEMSGLSLLGLQDFPGQGTALVGMLNSHMQVKPYDFARPERFRAFFRSELVLVGLVRYTYLEGETLEAKITVANYGKLKISGPVCYELFVGKEEKVLASGKLAAVFCPAGGLTEAGVIRLPLAVGGRPSRLTLHVSVGFAENTYPLWVYPPCRPVCPEGVYETEHFDEKARAVLAEGGIVYLSPRSVKEALPSSIQAQFTTDFWSVGTFPAQAGGMGQLIDKDHPIFREFPTEFHTNWQWWPMAGQRAIILPKPMESIITELDSFAYLRPMAQLLEGRCGGGRLFLSSLGLQELTRYPEAAALENAIYHYLSSEEFSPVQEIDPDVIKRLVP